MILQILLLFNCLPNVISSQPIFKIVFISIFFILSFHALFFLSSSFYHSFSHFFNIPFEFSLTHLFFLVWFAFPSLLSLSFICSASLKMFSCTSRCFLAYFLFFCSVFFVLFFVLFFFILFCFIENIRLLRLLSEMKYRQSTGICQLTSRPKRHGRCSTGGRHAFVGVGRTSIGSSVGRRGSRPLGGELVWLILDVASFSRAFRGCSSCLSGSSPPADFISLMAGALCYPIFRPWPWSASFGIVETEIPLPWSFPRSPGEKRDWSIGGPLNIVKGAGYPCTTADWVSRSPLSRGPKSW